jgi:hypothetical protein
MLDAPADYMALLCKAYCSAMTLATVSNPKAPCLLDSCQATPAFTS